MKKYRTGYNTAWRVKAARQRLLRCGFKAPGTYPMNQHEGKMFSMPKDIPVCFDGEEAGWVVRECFESRRPKLSKCMMESVRAMLSYAYQLKTGKHSTLKNKANFPKVHSQFGCQPDHAYGPATQELAAKFSVEPEGLKKSHTTEFDPACGIPFPRWLVGEDLSWCWNLNGCRAGKHGGMNRVKFSEEHEYVPSQGICRTKFEGGRPKTPGINHDREWWMHRVCMCPGAKHKPPPSDWIEHLDEQCNPVDPEWCTVCPVNVFKCIQDLLPEGEKGRIWPKWLPAQRRYSHKNVGRTQMIPEAQAWINAQGGNPDNLTFCSNSGRKALGKWCAELQIPYRMSFQLHGDLWTTWRNHYQKNLRRDPGFGDRKQSVSVQEATEALWLFARYCGRGRESREDPTDELETRQMKDLLIATLRSFGKGDIVSQILDRR